MAREGKKIFENCECHFRELRRAFVGKKLQVGVYILSDRPNICHGISIHHIWYYCNNLVTPPTATRPKTPNPLYDATQEADTRCGKLKLRDWLLTIVHNVLDIYFC